jgi:aminopeptidase N
MGLMTGHDRRVISRVGVASLALPVSLLAGGVTAPGAVAASHPAAGHTYAAARSNPRADPYYPAVGVTGVDALHYGLDLRWDDVHRTLTGTARIRFRATRSESSIRLDLGKPLHVSRVRLDGRTVTSTHTGHVLTMETGALARDSRHTVTITYSGTPHPVTTPTDRPDIARSGWTTTKDGQVWSVQEPFGAFTWYPVNDHPSDKAFYDVTLRTKKAWHGVTDGHLRSDRVVGAERVTRWHLGSPAASYLVALDIGPYRQYRDTGPHGLPVSYWVRPRNRGELPFLRRTPKVLRWLESKLGRFPFGQVGIVVSPTDSAEETQTMLTMGAGILTNRFGVSTLAHELAHQWYGDEVTPDNWPDLWMNETFAMYIQIRWDASHGNLSMQEWRRFLVNNDQQLRIDGGPPGRYHKRDFADGSVYYCGALMLDRLHTMLPHAVFAKLLRGWPTLHRFGNVHRSEWVRYLDRVSGRDLAPFVHRWLDSTSSPA